MQNSLNFITDVIPNAIWNTEGIVMSEEVKPVVDAHSAGDVARLEDMNYKLYQMGDFGKIWLGPDFYQNFHFLHWEWKCRYTQGTQTHEKLAEKSGVPKDRIQQLHHVSDERFEGIYFPTEDELQRLAECYQIPKDGLKGKSLSQEEFLALQKSTMA